MRKGRLTSTTRTLTGRGPPSAGLEGPGPIFEVLLEREISDGTGEVRGRFAIRAPEPMGTEEIGGTSMAIEPSGAAR